MEGSMSPASKAARKVLAEMDPDAAVETLQSWVRWRVRMLLCGLAMLGYGRAKVLQGYRTLEECERNYGKGRVPDECAAADVPVEYALPAEDRVTWILPKFNRHWRRRAVDIDLTMYVELMEDAIATLARSVGMIWGGEWSVRDTYHFEV